METKREIAFQRLHQQQLSHPVIEKAEEVVGWLGAVQAQDYAAAKWAVAQRSSGLSDADLDLALASGAILRTHIMRPTWHFVTPADIRWMQTLTAARNKATSAYYLRRLELDEALRERSQEVLAGALQDGKQLTRTELGSVLTKAGIDVHILLRLNYILMLAELDGVITSGGRRGKQFTYALLDERAPQTGSLDREEALAELTRRYFSGHGPATIQDFVWWSGLTAADVRAGLEMAGSRLAVETVEGVKYWYDAAMPAAVRFLPSAHLLPVFDEYIVGYTDRRAAFSADDVHSSNPRDAILFNHTLVIDGRVCGTWKRSFSKGRVLLSTKTFAALSEAEQDALDVAVERYAEFHGMPVVLDQTE
ncbi:MAG: winged helix DNA-binding domain-containing protein [Anaerolineaceae bacterium]|nr:winged helix DNA-binding domain-containing protein [Anaerolineaceae bacterium]